MEENINYEITEVICDEAITQEVYLQVGFKTYLCVLILNTGFEAIGHYSPIDAHDFSIAVGKSKSREAALVKAMNHLSSINQWKKAVNDTKAAEAEALKNSVKEENTKDN